MIPLQTTGELVTDAAFAAVASAVYGLVWYVRRKAQARKHNDEPVPFDPYKLGATVLLGAVIGAITAANGDPVTQENVVAKLALYGGYVAIIEGLLKTLRDEIQTSSASRKP